MWAALGGEVRGEDEVGGVDVEFVVGAGGEGVVVSAGEVHGFDVEGGVVFDGEFGRDECGRAWGVRVDVEVGIDDEVEFERGGFAGEDALLFSDEGDVRLFGADAAGNLHLLRAEEWGDEESECCESLHRGCSLLRYDLADVGFDLVFAGEACGLRDDGAVAVDEEGAGQVVDAAVGFVDLVVGVEDGVGDAGLLHGVLDGLFGCVVFYNADDLETLTFILLVELLEPRHFDLAGGAPGGPEVDEDGLAFEVVEGEFFAVERVEREAGSFFAAEVGWRRVVVGLAAFFAAGDEGDLAVADGGLFGGAAAVVGKASPDESHNDKNDSSQYGDITLHKNLALPVYRVRSASIFLIDADGRKADTSR